MKYNLAILIVALIAFSSCSTVYRSGQTPDDVYYSPAKEGAAYANVDRRNDNRYRNNNQNTYYDNGYGYDDMYLRMRVRNPYRWSAFDNSMMWNNWMYSPNMGMGFHPGMGMGFNSGWGMGMYPGMGMGMGFNTGWGMGMGLGMNPWNNYMGWNNFYNPYFGNIVVVNPKTQPRVYNQIRNVSPAMYTSRSSNNANTLRPVRLNQYQNNQYQNGINRPAPGQYNNTNSNSLGSSIRKVFTPTQQGASNNNRSGRYENPNNSNSNRPNRTYTPPTRSSNNSPSTSPAPSRSAPSGGGSSGGGGGVSRPTRGGGR